MPTATGDNGSRTVAGRSRRDPFEEHLCESCASANPLVNPALRYGPSAITEKLRVIRVSPQKTWLRLIRTDAGAAPEEWNIPTSRLPARVAVVGMEFEMTCTPEEFAKWKGQDDNAAS